MSLAVSDGMVSGIYESTTGSTGRYHVVGRELAGTPSAEAGQPVALAIAWRSFDDGPCDPSWNWASALGGQINLVDGEEILSLAHLMIATSDFEGICPRGVYSDKLTYRRVGGGLPSRPPDLATQASWDRLSGHWTADAGVTLELVIDRSGAQAGGRVAGQLKTPSGTFEVAGFTDVAAERIGFQSVAITAADTAKGEAIALGGWLDHRSNRLTLQSLASRSTGSDGGYVQTTLSPLFFAPRDLV